MMTTPSLELIGPGFIFSSLDCIQECFCGSANVIAIFKRLYKGCSDNRTVCIFTCSIKSLFVFYSETNEYRILKTQALQVLQIFFNPCHVFVSACGRG